MKSWSPTQPSQALPSAEAEYYGLVKAASVGLGCSALLSGLGLSLELRVWTDSSEAMGIAVRQGGGKVRHLDTKTLWVQQAVRTGRCELRKIKGTENPADLFTKHHPTAGKLEQLVELFGASFREGRAAAAPTMRRERLTHETLGDAYNVDEERVEYPTLVPQRNIGGPGGGDLIGPEDDEIIEQDEAGDPLGAEGMEIAGQLVARPGEFGRKRKFREREGVNPGTPRVMRATNLL